MGMKRRLQDPLLAETLLTDCRLRQLLWWSLADSAASHTYVSQASDAKTQSLRVAKPRAEHEYKKHKNYPMAKSLTTEWIHLLKLNILGVLRSLPKMLPSFSLNYLYATSFNGFRCPPE